MIKRDDLIKPRVWRSAPYQWAILVFGVGGHGMGITTFRTWREAYDWALYFATERTHHMEPCS